MTRLPSILARDYARNAAWPYVLAGLALTILTGVIGGIATASELFGWG